MKKPKLSRETYEQTMEIIRIGNRAVREAQAENHRLGLPNIYSINGRIIYEMPNGEIIVKKDAESAEISDEERQKLDERLKNFRENPDEGIGWEDFKKNFTKSE